MRGNKIVTYVLIGMIGLLVVIAGYKMWEARVQNAEQAEKDRQLNETLDYYGYLEQGDSSFTESSFDTTGSTASGIEYDQDPQPQTRANTNSNTSTNTSTPPKKTTSKPRKKASTPPPAKTGSGVKSEPKPPANSGRYMVITGAFRSISNARDEMESLVKMGYLNAEVRSLSKGYHHSIAYRSNNKNSAQQKAAELKGKFPGAYVKAAY